MWYVITILGPSCPPPTHEAIMDYNLIHWPLRDLKEVLAK